MRDKDADTYMSESLLLVDGAIWFFNVFGMKHRYTRIGLESHILLLHYYNI